MPWGACGPTAQVPVPPPPAQPPQDLSECHFADVLTCSSSPSHFPELFFSIYVGGKAPAKPLQPQWLCGEGVLMPESCWALGCDCQPRPSPSTIAATPPRLLPVPWAAALTAVGSHPHLSQMDGSMSEPQGGQHAGMGDGSTHELWSHLSGRDGKQPAINHRRCSSSSRFGDPGRGRARPSPRDRHRSPVPCAPPRRGRWKAGQAGGCCRGRAHREAVQTELELQGCRHQSSGPFPTPSCHAGFPGHKAELHNLMISLSPCTALLYLS